MAFSLVNLPDYNYSTGFLACPNCYKPVSRSRKDGRCDDCLKDRESLPVNYRRDPKRRNDEDEDEE